MMDKKIKIFIISAVVLAIVAAVIVAVVMMTKKKPPPPKTKPLEPLTPSTPKNEVFAALYDNKGTEIQNKETAQKVCDRYNSTLASPKQLQDAANAGAQWCVGSYLSSGDPEYPMQQTVPKCGQDQPGNVKTGARAVAAACYGIKPAKGTDNMVEPFGLGKWSQFS